MKTCEYNGKTYTRNNAKWLDSDNVAVPTYLQNILNTLTYSENVAEDMNYYKAKAEGDKCKEGGSYTLAIKYYRHAFEKAENERQVSTILPRITSCYRSIKKPEKVIEILGDAKQMYGDQIINEALLTSAAAAFCDMGEPEKALRCCRWAYSVLRVKTNETSPELSNVFYRAKKMLDPDYNAKESLERYEEENGIYKN